MSKYFCKFFLHRKSISTKIYFLSLEISTEKWLRNNFSFFFKPKKTFKKRQLLSFRYWLPNIEEKTASFHETWHNRIGDRNIVKVALSPEFKKFKNKVRLLSGAFFNFFRILAIVRPFLHCLQGIVKFSQQLSALYHFM